MSPFSRRIRRAALATALAIFALPAVTASAAPSGDAPIALNPTVQDFGLVEVDRGGDSRQIQIQNTSDSDVALGGTWLDGPQADRFWTEWSDCPSTLSPWQWCSVSVRFAPDDMGDFAATLHFPADGSEATVELSGSGGLRRVSPSPDVLDFGNAAVGDTVVRSVTMNNTGNLPFMSMVAIPTGGDVGAFRLLEDGCSLRVFQPGVGCKLKVRFEPFEVDNAQATLAIIGEGEPTVVTLRGVGIAPPEPVAEPAPAKTVKKRRGRQHAARVAFDWRRGLPAPYRDGRVDLGIARCQGAAACRVTIRTRIVSTAARSSGVRSTRVEARRLRLQGPRRITIALPPGMKGTPVRLVATIDVDAHRRPTGRQRLGVALVPGKRHGRGLVVVRR